MFRLFFKRIRLESWAAFTSSPHQSAFDFDKDHEGSSSAQPLMMVDISQDTNLIKYGLKVRVGASSRRGKYVTFVPRHRAEGQEESTVYKNQAKNVSLFNFAWAKACARKSVYSEKRALEKACASEINTILNEKWKNNCSLARNVEKWYFCILIFNHSEESIKVMVERLVFWALLALITFVVSRETGPTFLIYLNLDKRHNFSLMMIVST